MTTLILSFVLISLAVTGLSVGVLLGRKPIQGSCGGLYNFGDGGACELCGGDADKCDDLNAPGS